MAEVGTCELCGEPMPAGEEMFKFHGYSGDCPKPPKPKAENPERIREISVAVYKMRLESSNPGAVARMLEKDADDGQKLSGRAAGYDPLTRAYLKILGK